MKGGENMDDIDGFISADEIYRLISQFKKYMGESEAQEMAHKVAELAAKRRQKAKQSKREFVYSHLTPTIKALDSDISQVIFIERISGYQIIAISFKDRTCLTIDVTKRTLYDIVLVTVSELIKHKERGLLQGTQFSPV